MFTCTFILFAQSFLLSCDFCRLKGHLNDHFHGSRSPSRANKRHSHPIVSFSGSIILHLPCNFVVSINLKLLVGVVQGEDPVTASVSGRADDLAWRCSSDTFDLNGCAFESSANWAALSMEGDKPLARFDVIKILKSVSEKCKLKCFLISVW
jgi:hypothetical protein